MKRLLIALSLCALPLVGQAQVNITIGDVKFDPSPKRVYLPIENYTSEWLMLTPYTIPDRHKDTYSCVTYRMKDKDGKVIYDSNINPKPVPNIICAHFEDPIWYTWHTPGQLPLRNGISRANFSTWLIPSSPTFRDQKEAYEEWCIFSAYLDSVPENARTVDIDLFIRIYPMPNLKVDEKDKEKIDEHVYLIPKPVQPPLLYEKEIHKTFQLDK